MINWHKVDIKYPKVFKKILQIVSKQKLKFTLTILILLS